MHEKRLFCVGGLLIQKLDIGVPESTKVQSFESIAVRLRKAVCVLAFRSFSGYLWGTRNAVK
jgi:hypothetical protein